MTSIATAPAAAPLDVPPLEILVVTVAGGGLGGMQRHTHDLVRGLVDAGHEVEVICPAAPDLAPDLYGARWTLLETPGRSREWPDLVVRAFRTARTRFDVVHSESTSALPLVRARIPVPVVVTYHGNYLGLARAHLHRAAARPTAAHREMRALAQLTRRHFRGHNATAFRDCESMVVSRQQLLDTRRSHIIRPDRMNVVPNGVDLSLFRPRDPHILRARLGLPAGLIAVAVGRLNREKGFDVAIDAVAALGDTVPDMHLVVVGDGEEREALEAHARRRGVTERTLFVGGQPQSLVAEYLAASDVFLFPTRRDEAGPLVLPQAMGCALPVIASRIGGITEVLEPAGEPRAGVLVPPDDVQQVAAELASLLRSPDRRTELGAAARDRAEREYGLETMVRRTVVVYRQAIARFTSRHR